jgi:hypothetical protein
MVNITITETIKESLKEFVKGMKRPELIATYLHYVEKAHNLKPVIFLKDKEVYKSIDDAIRILSEEGRLFRETEIKVGYVKSSVNEETTKIYICPFTGKVFGNNTCPNPQDSIYDWVSKCPENKERLNGLKVKRFFISEDPEVIRTFAEKFAPPKPVVKIVYSSAITGKLFHSKDAIINEFRSDYVKEISLVEVLNQSRYQIEDSFMKYIQDELQEDNIAAFVEALSAFPEFSRYVEAWVGEVEQQEE